jgi:hypothetical protein
MLAVPVLVWVAIVTLNVSETQAAAGSQPPAPKAGGHADDDNFFKQFLNKKKLQVPRREAALCPICGEPYFLHTEPGFECLPKDKDVLKIKWIPLQCPVCNAAFRAARQGNINADNGMDRDFCRHSLGKVAVHSSVWLCPECGYAALERAFGKKLDGKPIGQKTVKKVRAELSPRTREHMLLLAGISVSPGKTVPPHLLKFGRYISQTSIPDWIKYENVLDLLPPKTPHTLKAKLHLEAAHANRRHVCSEIGIPGLFPAFLVNLGKAIRRMNKYILGECLSIRQRRKESILDPTRPETDPMLLAEAAGNIIEKGRQVVHAAEARRSEGRRRRGDVSRFSSRDMYVLHIQHAGFLDRAGRIPAAVEALKEARGMIPVGPEPGLKEEAQRYLNRQKALLRRIVDERIECLGRERKHLYRAADSLMGALYTNEKPKMNLTVNSYLVGEMLYRDGREPETALIWFRLAGDLIKHDPASLNESQRSELPKWIKERIAKLTRNAKGKSVDDRVQEAIARVRERGMASGSKTATVPSPGTTGLDDKPTSPTPANGSTRKTTTKSKRTRVDVLERYYKALSRYLKEKKEQAPTLKALVEAGYLRASAACLNQKGRLICPKTGKKLLYMRGTSIGDKVKPLIFPLRSDPDQTKLFGDGRIGVK